MSDLFSRLAMRALGRAQLFQPKIALRFAERPALPYEKPDTDFGLGQARGPRRAAHRPPAGPTADDPEPESLGASRGEAQGTPESADVDSTAQELGTPDQEVETPAQEAETSARNLDSSRSADRRIAGAPDRRPPAAGSPAVGQRSRSMKERRESTGHGFPAVDSPAVDSPAVDSPAVDSPAVDSPAVDPSAPDAEIARPSASAEASGDSTSSPALPSDPTSRRSKPSPVHSPSRPSPIRPSPSRPSPSQSFPSRPSSGRQRLLRGAAEPRRPAGPNRGAVDGTDLSTPRPFAQPVAPSDHHGAPAWDRRLGTQDHVDRVLPTTDSRKTRDRKPPSPGMPQGSAEVAETRPAEHSSSKSSRRRRSSVEPTPSAGSPRAGSPVGRAASAVPGRQSISEQRCGDTAGLSAAPEAAAPEAAAPEAAAPEAAAPEAAAPEAAAPEAAAPEVGSPPPLSPLAGDGVVQRSHSLPMTEPPAAASRSAGGIPGTEIENVGESDSGRTEPGRIGLESTRLERADFQKTGPQSRHLGDPSGLKNMPGHTGNSVPGQGPRSRGRSRLSRQPSDPTPSAPGPGTSEADASPRPTVGTPPLRKASSSSRPQEWSAEVRPAEARPAEARPVAESSEDRSLARTPRDRPTRSTPASPAHHRLPTGSGAIVDARGLEELRDATSRSAEHADTAEVRGLRAVAMGPSSSEAPEAPRRESVARRAPGAGGADSRLPAPTQASLAPRPTPPAQMIPSAKAVRSATPAPSIEPARSEESARSAETVPSASSPLPNPEGLETRSETGSEAGSEIGLDAGPMRQDGLRSRADEKVGRAPVRTAASIDSSRITDRPTAGAIDRRRRRSSRAAVVRLMVDRLDIVASTDMASSPGGDTRPAEPPRPMLSLDSYLRQRSPARGGGRR